MRKLDFRLIFGLVLSSGLLASGSIAIGQELLIPPSSEGMLQGSGMREALPAIELPDTRSNSPSSSNFEPIAEPIVAGELQPSVGSLAEEDRSRAFDYHPAILESTGTWLRRGFWFAEVDAVLSDRIWRKTNVVLAFQNNEAFGGFFGETGVAANKLRIEGGRSGAEAAPRFKLGRFLFRDHENRDHTAEFVAYGGGQWAQSGRLDAVNGGTLSVGSYQPRSVAGRVDSVLEPLDQGNVSFDGATSMQYDYESRFNSFELNYHVKSRMGKDRMEMEPSGRWVRRGQASTTGSLIAGIRYFDINEDFDWDAFGIDSDNDTTTAPETGNYRIRTDNDLIGAQLGFSWNYERPRWSLGVLNKSGMYLNHTNLESSFEVTGGVTSGDNEVTVDNISFITEGQVLAKYHLLQNLSLRAGFEVLYVTSLANAAEQINFAPVSSQIVDNGDSVYLGGSIGFEGYW